MSRKRLSRIWDHLKGEYGGLLNRCSGLLGAIKTGPDLLQALLDETSKPSSCTFTTRVPNITRFYVQLHKSLPRVHVLTWKDEDGSIGDVRLAKTDTDDELKRVLDVMVRSAKFRMSDRKARDESGNWRDEAGKWRPLRNLWQPPREVEFRPVLEAWRQQPGNELLPDFRVLEYVLRLTNEPDARSMPTSSPIVERFVLEVPGMEGSIDVLRRLNDDGSIGDLRMAPAQKERLPWVINVMDHGKIRSQARKTRALGQGERSAPNLWKPLQKRLEEQFKAFCRARRENDGRDPSTGAFVKRLNELCIASGDGVEVDAANNIRMHVVTPEGSQEAVTLLRRTDARGLASLRVIENDLSDQASVLKRMVSAIKNGQPKQAAAASSACSVPGEPTQPVVAKRTTSQPKLKDASQLKHVLELAVANKEQANELLAGVAGATGIPDRELRNWIDYDGSLLRAASALLDLRGYFDLREDLYVLFHKLGRPETADKLPEELSAKLIVQVLRARLAHPDATTTQLAHFAKAHPEAVERHFDVRHATFLRARNSTLRTLNDYAENRAELQAALIALGHTHRAARLPMPETETECFLRELEERLYPARIAVAQMRRDPAMSTAEAAQLVNSWPEMPALLDKLVAPDGTLRSAADIARGVQAFQPELQPRLKNLLSRLDPKTRSSPMVEELMPAQGITPGKVFIVREPPQPPDESAHVQGAKPLRLRRLERIYANSADLVVAPRSYRAERQKQALRWLSSVLKDTFSRAAEVQAYWDAQRREIWVSSNDSSANTEIAKFLAGQGLIRTLRTRAEESHATRQARHASKLRRMLNDESARPAQARELLGAMFDGRFQVPIEPIYSSTTGRRIGLHAERRIKLAFEKRYGEASLNRHRIAGTMRPCGICAKDLSLPNTARRGPFWLSRSGGEGYDVVAIAEESRNLSVGTYATVTRQGELTLAYNTDSTDDEPEPQGAARQRPPLTSVLGKRSAREMSSSAVAVQDESTKSNSTRPPKKGR